jgi:hypothetical protein
LGYLPANPRLGLLLGQGPVATGSSPFPVWLMIVHHSASLSAMRATGSPNL